MKIKLKVHSNSSQEKIKKINEKEYEIWIKQKPLDGKANAEVLKILKKYFNKKINIKSGLTSKKKIIEIL